MNKKSRIAKIRNNPYFWIFLAVSGLFSILYIRFLVGDYAYFYLDVGADTFEINYPLYCLFSDVLHSGEYEAYMLNAGLGMDMSSYFFQYLNPLNFLVIALPQRMIPWGILVASYLKLMLTGMFGYKFFCSVLGEKEKARKLGSFAAALAWTFSGYMVLWGQHYGFAASIAMFTVFMYLVQCYSSSSEKSHNGILVFWITLMLFTNYYFLYMSGLMGAGYLAVSLILQKKNWREVVRKLLGLGFMGILGICIGGICLIPTWNIFQDSIRAGTLGGESLISLVEPYGISWLLGFLGRMFSNNALGIGDFYTGPGNYYEIAVLSVSGLFLYGIAYFLVRKDTRKKTGILLGISLLMLLLPLTGKIFTMNSSTQRWTFFLCFWEALVIGKFIKDLTETGENKKELFCALAGGGVFTILSFGALWLGQSARYYDLFVKYLAIAGAFLALYAVLIWFLRKRKERSILLIGVLCLELVISNYASINFRENPTRHQVATEYYHDGSSEAAQAAAEGTKEPYRIAKTYESASENDGMAQGYPGISGYLTTLPRELIQFKNMYEGEGISINFADFDGEHYLKNSLLGVSYLLTEPGTPLSGQTYQYQGTQGGKEYYQYTCALPFGYFYNSQWDKKTLLDMTETQRVLASFTGFHFGGEASSTEYEEAEMEDISQGISLMELPMEVKDCSAVRDDSGILMEEMLSDPYIVLSKMQTVLTEGPIHTVTIMTETEETVDMAIYYKTEGETDFNEEQLSIFQVSPENSQWTGTLPPDVTEIRIDVSSPIDRIRIKEINISNCESLNEAYEKLQNSPVTDISWDRNTYQAVVENESEDTGMLCVPFIYGKGWKGEIDGEAAEVYNVNSGLIGIEVPGGTHEIKLYYEIPHLWLGVFLSVTGLAVWLFVFAVKRQKKGVFSIIDNLLY